jgi:hypothetical protein
LTTGQFGSRYEHPVRLEEEPEEEEPEQDRSDDSRWFAGE